jgi:hypothetical protein
VAQATLDRESQLVPDSLENYTRQEPWAIGFVSL